MHIVFSNGLHEVCTKIREDYVASIFAAHKRLTDEEPHPSDATESELWHAAVNSLTKLCRHHANFIRNELDLGTQWEWTWDEDRD